MQPRWLVAGVAVAGVALASAAPAEARPVDATVSAGLLVERGPAAAETRYALLRVLRLFPLVLLLWFAAFGAVPAGQAGRLALQPRLMFASAGPVYSEHPSYNIYSLSSTGTLAQATFTGGVDPVPSPNGRLVAFARGPDLWLMRPDGNSQRLLARNSADPSWTPDSRHLAYVGTDSKGLYVIRVAGTNGKGGRTLLRGRVHDPTWSPDGRTLAFVRDGTSVSILRGGRQHVVANLSRASGLLTWSADGRWLADAGCTGGRCGVFVVRPSGSGRRVLSSPSPVTSLRWSPRGRLLAYLAGNTIATFDVATGNRHLLVNGADPRGLTSTSITWSPDGTRIAYDVQDYDNGRSALYAVSLGGKVQTLGVYPQTGGLAWTTPPGGLDYQAPQGQPVALGDELRLPMAVNELAADGNAVAYRTCEAISVWRPSATTLTTVRGEMPLCGPEDDLFGAYSLALAGDRVGWGEVIGGGTSQETSLFVVSVQPNAGGQNAVPSGPFSEVLAGNGERTGGDPRGTNRVGYLLGAAPLLVFSSWAYCDDLAGPIPESCYDLPPAQRPLGSQTLWRMRESSWPGTCPGANPLAADFLLTSARCQQLLVEPGALRPLDVDAGRIVASGDNATLILNQDGQQLLSVPVSTQAAQLSGTDLVILLQGNLRDYDAITGTLLHSWPLPDVSVGGPCRNSPYYCSNPRLRLEGAAHGLVAYLLDGKLHLLRLPDGADSTVADATSAQLDDSGLFYAYTTTGDMPGRIRFVPYNQLPLR